MTPNSPTSKRPLDNGPGRVVWRTPRLMLVGLAMLGVFFYSAAVLWFVAMTGDTGIRCVFGPRIKELAESRWAGAPRAVASELRGSDTPPGRFSAEPPRASRDGDRLTMLGGRPIANYADFVRAGRHVRDRIGEFVEVRWLGRDGPEYGYVEVRRPPFVRYVGSFIWFILEMAVFCVGAGVLWKRPRDESARVFFALCVVTVVAFMGGYHWSQIAGEPLLIYPFAAAAVLVPVTSLHFYLILPRPNPYFARHRAGILTVLYGLPTLVVLALWVAMGASRWGQDAGQVDAALQVVRILALGYIGLSVVIFVMCLICLVHGYRTAPSRAERNQVRWVLMATILSVPAILWLLWDASGDPARLGMSRSAWPMSIVSILYTLAYAFSITRYKLMQAEDLFNRSVVYVVVTVAAGLLYSGILVVGALVIGERLLGNQASLGTVVACVTALVVLVATGALRPKVQRVIDRRFYRETYKVDRAMRKMSLAVGSLVDRPTLGRRLLEAAGEVLHAEWGAVYLSDSGGSRWTLAACSGGEPDDARLAPDNPLVARLRDWPEPLKVSHAPSLAAERRPAVDAMIALGGEVATPLEARGELAGLMVLGPKRSGMPYEDEELAFLGALGSVATLALRSADIQQTLEGLNDELRRKVEKIAEQQRRIYVLQEQLNLERSAMRAEPEPNGHAAPVPVAAADEPAADDSAFAGITGTSPAIRGMLRMARKVAPSPSAVLILGESGTGKERLAESIHAASPRAGRPLVKVHCASLAQSLLESELFGHVKGAFTDAKTDRVGRFQQADGGTLFLDEIGDISPEVQVKLLRVLQEMAFERVGSSQTITVDVRVIAATNRDLEALIRAGRFREDLYYRLNVISIRTPSLRDRREDILPLATQFLATYAGRAGKSVARFDELAVEALLAHDWPGNIRELENVVERAVVLCDGIAIGPDDLPPELCRPARRRARATFAATAAPGALAPVGSVSGAAGWDEPEAGIDLDAELAAHERRRLLDALSEARRNKSEAARLLGMPRSTFFSKLRKHGLA
jgi:transcriptional regulator with GAF, ATPase, and Fis domain